MVDEVTETETTLGGESGKEAGELGTVSPKPATPQGTDKDQSTVDYEVAHKEMQSKFSKLSADLAEVGGLESLLEDRELLKGIIDDPKFQKLLSDDDSTTTPQEELTPEQAQQKAALELVDKRIDEKIGKALAPLTARESKRGFNTVFADMEDKYKPLGIDWTEMKPQMNAILKQGIEDGSIPKEADTHPSFNTVDSLFIKAYVDNKGGLEKVGAEVYEKKLTEAKAKAVGRPTISSGVEGEEAAGSVKEAYRVALRKHGGAVEI